MTKAIHKVGCKFCGASHEAAARKSFWGFSSFACNECGRKNELPLSVGYLTAYVFFMIVMSGTLAREWPDGAIGLPIFLFALLGFALAKDLVLRILAKK